MSEHPINKLLDISLDKVIHMIDTQKIIGEPIEISDNRTIIPISKVTFGFGAGGSEFDHNVKQKKSLFNVEAGEELFPFGGGSAGGVSMAPMAFLVVENNEVKILSTEKQETSLEKIFDVASKFLNEKYSK